MSLKCIYSQNVTIFPSSSGILVSMKDIANLEFKDIEEMRRGEPGYDYMHSSYHFPPHSSSLPVAVKLKGEFEEGPLRRTDEKRVPEWELPQWYSLGYRTVHPEGYSIPKQPQPSQPSQPCFSPCSSDEWHSTGRNDVQHQCKKQNICIFLTTKEGLCVEVDNPFQINARDLMEIILHENQELSLPPNSREIFSLWLVSPLLELQLKPQQKPLLIRQHWMDLLLKFTLATPRDLDRDEPVLCFRRNVFVDKREEMRVEDTKVLKFLYEEAKGNILEGRYLCDPEDCDVLAGIQARLELGPYNPQIHTAEYFRSRIGEYLPDYACKSGWSFLNFSAKRGPEHRILDKYRTIPSSTTTYKLFRRYLEFCWALPCYGSAFFSGQVERPARGLAALVSHHDISVLVGINKEGVHIFNQNDACLLLSRRYKHFSWDYGDPSQPDNPNCLPCLFLQFKVLEENPRESMLLQIFSQQAFLMDTLISTFVKGLQQRSWSDDQVDHMMTQPSHEDDVPITTKRIYSETCLINNLKKLCLATFNDKGQCIDCNGSMEFCK